MSARPRPTATRPAPRAASAVVGPITATRLPGQRRASPARDERAQRRRAGECRRVEGGQRRQIGDRDRLRHRDDVDGQAARARALARSSSRPPSACGNRTRVPARRASASAATSPSWRCSSAAGTIAAVRPSAARARAVAGPTAAMRAAASAGQSTALARAGAGQPDRRRAGEDDPAVVARVARARDRTVPSWAAARPRSSGRRRGRRPPRAAPRAATPPGRRGG